MNRRVVITGVGLTSPIGSTYKELNESLRNGKHGVRRQTEWDALEHLETLRTRLAAPVDAELPTYPRRKSRTMGRVSHLASSATEQAIADAGITEGELRSGRVGLAYGSTNGSTTALEEYCTSLFSTGFAKISGAAYLKFMSHTCAANLAQLFEIRGRVISTSAACVSASQAIGAGYELIRAGQQEVVLAGGAEEMHYIHAGVFDVLYATSTRNDEPDLTPRPFDKDRDGLVVGEGSGTVALESYERAMARGSHIYGEIIGYGSNCDGAHLTSPSVDGMASAMRLALDDAEVNPGVIDYINAHATATEAGDICESKATEQVLGTRPPISSTKGYMGHTLGACGAIETIACLGSFEDGFLPASRNLENVDPRCAPLDYLMEPKLTPGVATIMNNNFAFGGLNTSLILRKIS
ncbi:MAG: beta-ketoacyl-ACP synthase [Myxococcales bacterium]|nr:beta-ketoacyl-ACP synthase [Myxococcales bacterium]